MAAPDPGVPTRIPLQHAGRRRRWPRIALLALAAIWLTLALWHTHKPLPQGVHVTGGFVPVPAASLRLLVDVSARSTDGTSVRAQSIHLATLELVRGARDFLLLDFFLFNGQGGPRGALRYENGLAPVSSELIAAVRELKLAQPGLPVLVLVDPINGYYRGTATAELAALEAAGVDLVVTRLDGLRDSNPVYSATWRMLFGWWLPADGEGIAPNLLDGAGPKLRPGAMLRLPNFKANHRKVALTGDGAGSLVGIVSSANPHDASSLHSNVALRIEGEALRPLLGSELAIAAFSGWQGGPLMALAAARPAPGTTLADGTRSASTTGAQALDTRVAVVTEGAIRDAVLERFTAAGPGDAIDVAQFYLAERGVIEALLAAARRGVTVRVLLDPNRDAFGFEKSGIPNRPVGHELVADSDGAIALRWYRTHGEQFHAKLAAVRSGERLWFTLGSANFTRRNIGDYNLEANVVVDAPADSDVATGVTAWFATLWNNGGGVSYSDEATTWTEAGLWPRLKYRFMEASGMSTF